MKLIDNQVQKWYNKNQNLLVAHFLIHSYLYYKEDCAIISDSCFDDITKKLDDKWNFIEHPHKHLIDRDMIKSGFYLVYPNMVIKVAKNLYKKRKNYYDK